MKRRLISGMLILMLLGCGPQLRVFTDFTPETSPAFFRTYDWKVKADIESGQNPVLYNELNDQRIKQAVNKEMEARSYVLSENSPGLIAHYHIVVHDQPFASIPYDYDYSNFEYWVSRHSVSSYKEGTLIIDFMDNANKSLIWRGWAVAVLDDANSPEKVQQLIKLSVSKIMKNFPKCAIAPERLNVSAERSDQ